MPAEPSQEESVDRGRGGEDGAGLPGQGGAPSERLATDALLPLVYQELRTLAASMLAGERGAQGGGGGGAGGANGVGATLQPTVLVHEAYLRLLGPQDKVSGGVKADWENRRHFFGAAAIAMRRILIDRARHVKGLAGKVRGDGGVSVEDRSLPAFEHEVDETHGPGKGRPGGGRGAEAMLRLDAAMEGLGKLDARRHEVVMLRFFAGLTVEQTAQVLGVSPATVKNDWAFARAWLLRAMAGSDGVKSEGSGGAGL